MARGEVITAAERIEEKFGGKWKPVGESILFQHPSIPTGSIKLDEALGPCKGIPEGAILEIYGPQHSGKTLMGYLAISAAQKKYAAKDNLIIDAERSFQFQAPWAKQVGVDVAKLYVSQVVSAEECFDKLELAILGDVELDKDGNVKKVVKPGNFAVILVDSVSQLTPLELVNKDMDKSKRMAALASVMSTGLKKLVSAMTRADSKTVVIFINQIRSNPNAMFGNPETRTGGMALQFYDTILWRITKVKDSTERDAKGMICAHQVKVKFEKNKAGQLPAEPIVFKLRYDGTGIDNDFELADVAEKNGLLLKVHGGYLFVKPGTEEPFNDSMKKFKMEDIGAILKENPKIKEMIMNFIKEGKFYSENVEEEFDEVDEGDEKASKMSKKQVESTEDEKPIEPIKEKSEKPEEVVETAEEKPEQSLQEKRRGRRKIDA